MSGILSDLLATIQLTLIPLSNLHLFALFYALSLAVLLLCIRTERRMLDTPLRPRDELAILLANTFPFYAILFPAVGLPGNMHEAVLLQARGALHAAVARTPVVVAVNGIVGLTVFASVALVCKGWKYLRRHRTKDDEESCVKEGD